MSELKKLDLNQKPAIQTDDMAPTEPMPTTSITNPKTIMILALIALAGIATGFSINKFFPRQTFAPSTLSPNATADNTDLKVGQFVGIESDTFSDSAEGIVEKGGLNGEGSHKLIRPGGTTQTVYLTSSVVDLDQLVGHKVEIWGETFSAQKAGWLMDVGRVKVLELNVSQGE